MTKALRIFAVLVAFLWSVAGMCPTASAGATAPADQPPTQTELVDDTLRQMLDGLGLEPKPLSKGFLISVKRDSWTYYVQLVLSGDKTKIGMNANLGKVDDPDTVTAAQWKALLVANGDIDPSTFYFDNQQKKLFLHRTFDNRALTPAFLRGQIENFVANIKSTADLWKFAK